MRHQRFAFTLIEMLVIIVLMSIMAAMIVPRMGRSLENQQTLLAASEFAQTVRTVADLAVARHQQLAIEVDAKGYGVAMQSQDSSQYQPVRVSWLRDRAWPSNVRLLGWRTPDGANATGDSHRLEFRPDGSSSGVELRLGGDREVAGVSVNPGNGRTRIESGDKHSNRQDQYDLGD